MAVLVVVYGSGGGVVVMLLPSTPGCRKKKLYSTWKEHLALSPDWVDEATVSITVTVSSQLNPSVGSSLILNGNVCRWFIID